MWVLSYPLAVGKTWVGMKIPWKAGRVNWLPGVFSYSSVSLFKSLWVHLALACEGSTFFVGTLAALSRKGNVIKDVRYPTES